MPVRGGRGPWLGKVWVPTALTQWPEEDAWKPILCVRALGPHGPFPAQLANILKHKPGDSAYLGCILGIGVCVSPKLELASHEGWGPVIRKQVDRPSEEKELLLPPPSPRRDYVPGSKFPGGTFPQNTFHQLQPSLRSVPALRVHAPSPEG